MRQIDTAQKARRQRILAATREALAERGYEGLTIRELAQRSGVSVPTLYNQFGGKDDLIRAAVEEHFRGILAEIEPHGAHSGLDRIQQLVARAIGGITNQPRYHRALLGAFARTPETAPLHTNLAVELVSYLRQALQLMSAEGQLAAWIVPEHLATQLATACIGAAMAWAARGVGDSEVRAFAEYSVGLLLSGACTEAARSEIQSYTNRAQAELTVLVPSNLPAPSKPGPARSRTARTRS